MTTTIFITEAEVHAACDELDREGVDPTADKIRIRLGHRGSKTTIARFRDTWRKLRKAGEPGEAVPEMPEAVKQALAEAGSIVWARACASAEARAIEAVAPLQSRITALEAERDEGERFVSVLEAESVQKDEEIARLRSEIAALQTSLADGQALRAGLEGELRALRGTIETMAASLRRPEPVRSLEPTDAQVPVTGELTTAGPAEPGSAQTAPQKSNGVQAPPIPRPGPAAGSVLAAPVVPPKS